MIICLRSGGHLHDFRIGKTFRKFFRTEDDLSRLGRLRKLELPVVILYYVFFRPATVILYFFIFIFLKRFCYIYTKLKHYLGFDFNILRQVHAFVQLSDIRLF